jgi:iron complex transport system permease protein
MAISPMQQLSIILNALNFPAIEEINSVQESIFLQIRLPRIFLAVLIGGGLAVSGAALQALFRNPLADPSFVGISSGASLFAVIGITLLSQLTTAETFPPLIRYYALNLITFAGALIAGIFVYRFSRYNEVLVTSTVLLSGIAINAFCGSFTGLIIYHSNDEELRNITFWMLGSLGGASWNTLIAVTPFILIPTLILPGLAQELNIFTLGEAEANTLGVNTTKLKNSILLLTTLIIGASVAVSGIIGFVGLVVPHILRTALGPDNRLIMPASILFGATLLCLADTCSRILVAPAELPLGILTALIGTPIFLWILIDRRKEMLL